MQVWPCWALLNREGDAGAVCVCRSPSGSLPLVVQLPNGQTMPVLPGPPVQMPSVISVREPSRTPARSRNGPCPAGAAPIAAAPSPPGLQQERGQRGRLGQGSSDVWSTPEGKGSAEKPEPCPDRWQEPRELLLFGTAKACRERVGLCRAGNGTCSPGWALLCPTRSFPWGTGAVEQPHPFPPNLWALLPEGG